MTDTEYEPAEHSHAKDHAMEALETELERQGISGWDPDGNFSYGLDLIDLADAVVERLIKEGVTIPESIRDPQGVTA